MKVSDYLLNFLAAHGVDTVFLVTGGVVTRLVDAFHGRTDIKYICVQHEQAAAMAADGYARFKGLGVAMATSGPGATNLITGIGCSYFDSIPTLFITGQVNTFEQKGKSAIRQRGFQETDIVSIVRPITKYARQVSDPKDVHYSLEAAIWYAQNGRPGPVLLDIPMDVQNAEIDPDKLPHFAPEKPVHVDISREVAQTVELIANAKRPVIIYGAGCRKYRSELLDFIERTGIPCLPSWAALDLIPHDHPLFVSQFGVYGARVGNLAVQNADLVIAIGTRLDTRMTGGKPQTFAPKAVRVVCDIDIAEATKSVRADVLVIVDAGEFLNALKQTMRGHVITVYWDNNVIFRAYDSWRKRIDAWKDAYPINVPSKSDKIQPLDFISALSDALPDDAIVVADAGANLTWVQQGLRLHGTQRLFSAYGYSPMGYSLPASIGAYYATGKPVVCIIGDGGVQMNIQELQTLAHYQIPVKVFIMNNQGYGIIRQFQEELFQGRYEATDAEHGVSNPDFLAVAAAYGLGVWKVTTIDQLQFIPGCILCLPPVITNVAIDPLARILPKTRFGDPLERQSPYLPDDEQEQNMSDEILERF